jgi:hypothetical protein
MALLPVGLAMAMPGAQAATPTPQLGKTVVVRPVKGTVLANGERLEGPREIDVGSVVDARAGTVRLTSARDDSASPQSGRFTRGRFRVAQSSKPRAGGLTVLRLVGSAGEFKTCSGNRTIRRLDAEVHGHFRTRGRYAAATAGGTQWTMRDTCDGTTTAVTRGDVVVHDFVRSKNVTVSAGGSYAARPR